MKKKVLFTATVDSHIIQFHIPFLRYFKENGYEVHVATNSSDAIPYCDVKHCVSFERSPFRFKNIQAIRQLKKICDKEKFSIIHTHTPMGSVVTRLAAKNARKKFHTRVIYTAHGFHFFKGAPLKNWLLYYPVEKIMAKYTDSLILINREDYDLAKRKFNRRCNDIQYVPGVGIDLDRFKSESDKSKIEKLKKSLGIINGDFVLTYIARLDSNKNQALIIECMKDLVKDYPNIHLLLVGPDELNGKYQTQAKKYLKNIHFLGFRKDIVDILNITDISISTSLREGLPVNLLEAMAAGVPVVATDTRGVRDLIKNGENGFVSSANNKDELYNNIVKLYNSPSIRKKMSDNNLKDIKKYDIDEILNKMKKIYCKKTIILHLLASNSFSGAENVVCSIIDNMNDNYSMYYCSPNGPIKEKLDEKGIEYIPIKKLSYGELKRVIKLIQPSIIHAHDNKATVFASLFNKKCTIISHIHGNNKIMNSKNIKTILFNIISKRVKKIIWVSDSSYNSYFFKKNVKDKSLIIRNVVNEKNIILKSKEYRVDKKYDLIFLGRLAYPKNPEKLISIIEILKKHKNDISVAVVGDGNERSQVEEMCKNLKLSSNITFYGFVNNPYPILKESKILIMTSIYEGTPMSALEALCLKKPIVSTPVDGLKDIVMNGYNGFLCEDNIDFSKNIEMILNDEKLLSELSNNSFKVFKEKNKESDYYSKIDSIYKGDL